MAKSYYKNNATKIAEMNADPRTDDRVDDESNLDQGYWLYSARGWMFPEMGCHTAHEMTIKDLYRVYRTIAPCTCTDCTK